MFIIRMVSYHIISKSSIAMLHAMVKSSLITLAHPKWALK